MPSPVAIDESGDFIAWTPHPRSGGIIQAATYGTFFDVRRSFGPPDFDFTSTRGFLSPQPQPVSLGPASLLGSWFSFNQTMSGDQVDELCRSFPGFLFRAHMLAETLSFVSPQFFTLITTLPPILFYFILSAVGGPNRPIPEKPQLSGTEEGLASTAAGAAAGIAASASAMQSNLYNRLASAVNERGYVCFSTTQALRSGIENH